MTPSLQYNFSSLYGAEAITTESLDKVYSGLAREDSTTLAR
jgi:hypothetical protein